MRNKISKTSAYLSEFNYRESSDDVGVLTDQSYCYQCTHSRLDSGFRSLGVVRTQTIYSKDFGKLVFWCGKHEAYVDPNGTCDALILYDEVVEANNGKMGK